MRAAPVRPLGQCVRRRLARQPDDGSRHVADPLLDEPTFLEFHPDGSRYDSTDAPVAPLFFPFNRCDIWHCGRCDQHWLRYTEFGGYYIDPRSRRLDPARVMDAPLPRTAAE